jgi:cytochrome c biogenesis protein CcmG, thiol:disulfide interchange protein DsbE
VANVRVLPAIFCLTALALATPMLAAASLAHGSALRMAPDFTRTDLDGKSLNLRKYRGKVVLLNFWATWCGPCLIEIPTFTAWQNTYRTAGLQVVGISMDDDAAPVKRMYQKDRLNYPVAMGDAELGELFGGVLGLPLTYLIDPDGRIVGRYQGEPDLKRLEARIKSLLPRP